MNKYQIMALMMREENQVKHANLYTISALLAERVAALSSRLSENEIDDFVKIGAAVYRLGLAEFGAAVPIEDLFPANENWPCGPAEGRNGFRSDRSN